MTHFDPRLLGILLIALGTSLLGMIFLCLRPLAWLRKRTPPLPSLPIQPGPAQNEAATLLVQSGGRLAQVNPRARQLFGLVDAMADIESLARRLAPADYFYSLCATEGQAALTLDGRPLEAHSYLVPSENGRLVLVALRPPTAPVVSEPAPQTQAVVTANQTALAEQNALLNDQTRSLTTELEQHAQERTAQLEREHKRTETLLRLSTELTNSLDLDRVFSRTLPILNEIVDAEHISVLVRRPGEAYLHHLASYGYAPSPPVRGRPTAFKTSEGLAGWVIQNAQPALIPDVRLDPRWVQLAGAPSEHRSAIAVPMLVGNEALGALLFFHRKVDFFSDDHLDLIQAAANQAAVAINNAELYNLIRDQAEDLGNMFHNQQVETSRSQAILEDVADGVLVTDAQGRITLFNASAERMLGLQREQVVGRSLDQFSGLFGGAAQAWMDAIRRWSLEAGDHPGETYEEQISLEDGRVVSAHLAAVRLGEDFLGTVSIFRDITHQVELDRLKSEFVATVSHELRTPMTSIKGYVELLLMGAAGQVSAQQTRFLEIIRDNTERLAMLVNDLLDISRIEAGRVRLAIQPLNLSELGRQAVTRLEERSRRERKSIQVDLDCPADLPRASGDYERVEQILDNLLENAYLYTPENGRIQVRMRQSGEEIQVDIQDNGVGIPPELHERVFERFYRGENAYVLATAGTGLGLAIVRTLVEMHHGRIWVTSSGVAGEGSCFSFSLPMHAPEESQVRGCA